MLFEGQLVLLDYAAYFFKPSLLETHLRALNLLGRAQGLVVLVCELVQRGFNRHRLAVLFLLLSFSLHRSALTVLVLSLDDRGHDVTANSVLTHFVPETLNNFINQKKLTVLR